MVTRAYLLLLPAIVSSANEGGIEEMLILIAVAAGMFGGVFAGMYFGKVYPVRPGEWRHHVYLALGIILILLAAALAAFLAVCH